MALKKECQNQSAMSAKDGGICSEAIDQPFVIHFQNYLASQGRKKKKATSMASQVALVVKNLPADAGDMRCRFNPWVGKISWRRKW